VLSAKFIDGPTCWPHMRQSTRSHITYFTFVDRSAVTPLLRLVVDLWICCTACFCEYSIVFKYYSYTCLDRFVCRLRRRRRSTARLVDRCKAITQIHREYSGGTKMKLTRAAKRTDFILKFCLGPLIHSATLSYAVQAAVLKFILMRRQRTRAAHSALFW